MKMSFGLACMLGLGLALTSTTSGFAQGGQYQGKKGPPVVMKHKGGSHHSHHGHSNRGRNVAAGVAAGVIGAIILNEAARASGGGYDGEHSCESLERRCDRGQDWACRKLDRNSC